MKNTLRIIGIVLLAGYAALQLLLSATVFGQNALIGIVFVVAGLGIIAGLVLRQPIIVGIGLLASLAAPVAVGLTGIEPFELIHHIVRLVVVALICTPLVLGGWPRRSRAASPAVAVAD